MNASEVMDVNSRSIPGKKGPAPKLRGIEVERAANGGFIATHRFMNGGPGPYKESEQHTFGADEGHKLLTHMSEHLGIEKEPKGDEDSAAGAAE